MEEREARELLKELFERHNISVIPAIFYRKPITKKEKISVELGVTLTFMLRTKGTFNVNTITGECWIEFYGRPSPRDVRHEFRHYLAHLGVEYIRKSPTQPKAAEG